MALTDRQKVRLLVGDVDSSSQIFTDDEVDYFLDDAANDVKLAASLACFSLAANQALIDRLLETGEFKTDRRGISARFLALGNQYKEEVESAPATGCAERGVSAFAYEQIVRNAALRSG
jgi:hypothetical protein